MEYISTRNKNISYSFKDVFLKGLAPDGGLFVPKTLPVYSAKTLKKFKNFSYEELATEIVFEFCKEEFTKKEVKDLIKDSYRKFRTKEIVKIKKLEKKILLELFHGPTLAFKDIAMQVIGNMYEKILKKNNLKVNIVVATSGDTGAAAISAIKNRKNMKIFVLHPDNKISEIQRKFMTTVNSSNVFNIALAGNFDECQKFVKSMFSDKNFSDSINMSGVNSINWARIVIQIVYYFFSYFKIAKEGEKVNFSVPTGNFGDIYAGYVAKKMGLPINKLIIATNSNDILKRTINTGIYKPLKVNHTISPSMDIQIASNFERLIFDAYLCDTNKTFKLMNDLNLNGELKIETKELKRIQESFCSESLSENETKSVLKEVYEKQKVLVDPHTAVAIGASKKLSLEGNTIILATAHPAKFSESIVQSTGVKSDLPNNLKNILIEEEKFDKLPKDLNKIQQYILQKV
tara:strand:- start:556 stop:1935 length:1380 start_codon:yes stop_codon:yes gene_type:complete